MISASIAGAMGGFVAAYLVNQFQTLWTKAAKKFEAAEGLSEERGEDSTVKGAAYGVLAKAVPKKQEQEPKPFREAPSG